MNVRPLRLLFLVAFAFVLAPRAHAKRAFLDAEVWILEFEDLERMTPENRLRYLSGVRDAIVEFERSFETPVSAPAMSLASAVSARVPANMEARPGETACRAKKPGCGDMEKARRYYYSQNARPCFYGGNLSSQQKIAKDQGRCRPVTSFKVSESYAPIKCATGQALCNPLIFGVAKLPSAEEIARNPAAVPTPFCVAGGAGAVERCHQKAPKDNGAKFLESSIMGLRNSWDEWKNDAQSICDERTGIASARFHCHECGALLDRLFFLKTEIRGNLCKDLAGFVDSTPNLDH